MNDAVSQPPNAKNKSDQKMMSLKWVLGTIEWRVNVVADPNRCQAMKPITITMAAGTHMATAPTLCSHLPTSSPTKFISVAAARVTNEKMMKNVGLAERCLHCAARM